MTTLAEQVRTMETLLNGKRIFTSPNYGVITGVWQGKRVDYGFYGPGVRNWRSQNEKLITAMRQGKLI